MKPLVIFLAALLVMYVISVMCSPRVQLVTDGHGNETLITKLGGGAFPRGAFYLIDTAFSGAPVISLSYAAHAAADRRLASTPTSEVTKKLAKLPHPGEIAKNRAVTQLIYESGARVYTSGCTMRLASIGKITENFSDLLLCDALRTNHFTKGGDVFVTNDLESSPNILTSDFLYHRAPVVISPRSGQLSFRATAFQIGTGFHIQASELVAGAPCVRAVVGGVELQLVVDTGASAALAVNPDVKFDGKNMHERVDQLGVNGERVCSAIFQTRVQLANHTFEAVEVFQNQLGLAHAQGYVGLGLLRCFDLLINVDSVGFRFNGLAPRRTPNAKSGTC